MDRADVIAAATNLAREVELGTYQRYGMVQMPTELLLGLLGLADLPRVERTSDMVAGELVLGASIVTARETYEAERTITLHGLAAPASDVVRLTAYLDRHLRHDVSEQLLTALDWPRP